MSAVIFPLTLPGPSLSSVTPAERRLLSDVSGGPQQARGLQRDYLATQRGEWDVLSAAAAAAFDTWWKVSLLRGGAWFASTWPAPQGWVSVVRRFIGAPQWTHLPGGFWRVSAQFQVRGRGMPPVFQSIAVDLNAIANSGATSANGITVPGIDPAAVYQVNLPSGRLYTAWSYNSSLNAFNTLFQVTTSAGTTGYGSNGVYSTAAAAYAAWPGGVTLTGFAQYTFWLSDPGNLLDNLGGMSLLLDRIS